MEGCLLTGSPREGIRLARHRRKGQREHEVSPTLQGGHGERTRARTRLDRTDPSLVRERFMPDQELLVLAGKDVVRDDR